MAVVLSTQSRVRRNGSSSAPRRRDFFSGLSGVSGFSSPSGPMVASLCLRREVMRGGMGVFVGHDVAGGMDGTFSAECSALTGR